MTNCRGLTREEILQLLDLDEPDVRDDDSTVSDSESSDNSE